MMWICPEDLKASKSFQNSSNGKLKFLSSLYNYLVFNSSMVKHFQKRGIKVISW
jgi:hypothetical protein